jgi:hypothetical protein
MSCLIVVSEQNWELRDSLEFIRPMLIIKEIPVPGHAIPYMSQFVDNRHYNLKHVR